MTSLSPKQELEILAAGEYQRIVGIDEVGRGCWAGPVAVGAYVFHAQQPRVRGVNDSKKLLPAKRRHVYAKLQNHDYSVLYGAVADIDRLGIAVMIENLIAQLIEQFQGDNTLFLIDGKFRREFGQHTRKVIDGDAIYYSIAAASILAKVERDDLMYELSKQFPAYDLASNKGYGTKFHQEAIATHGICELHRRSWDPISLITNPQLQLELD